MEKKVIYDQQLNKGLRVVGEDKTYFAISRIKMLRKELVDGFQPKKILDYGCGVGDSSHHFADIFPSSEIYGFDIDKSKIDYAKKRYSSYRIAFLDREELDNQSGFDLCYINGVFHHIPVEQRVKVVELIHNKLAQGGFFGLFENNPWNPGTHLVMKLIPFDKDAKMLSPVQSKSLMLNGGFSLCSQPKFLFYFPRFLSVFRFFERYLSGIPLGGQYFILSRKN